jgi:hypothetical protein
LQEYERLRHATRLPREQNRRHLSGLDATSDPSPTASCWWAEGAGNSLGFVAGSIEQTDNVAETAGSTASAISPLRWRWNSPAHASCEYVGFNPYEILYETVIGEGADA